MNAQLGTIAIGVGRVEWSTKAAASVRRQQVIMGGEDIPIPGPRRLRLVARPAKTGWNEERAKAAHNLLRRADVVGSRYPSVKSMGHPRLGVM